MTTTRILDGVSHSLRSAGYTPNYDLFVGQRCPEIGIEYTNADIKEWIRMHQQEPDIAAWMRQYPDERQ